ncbi:MAG: FtsX-like permease family protein [Nitrospinaceae bacterium]|nr:FtsX-like permease family protein [Nitrospinaceae bacterium]NIR54834.1 FtsX-like permease family protein [Nitrospinaceae bacterium]NIS85259.1 FtsX-like permease family protein [Nitrospinaceae bacterium]NIT82072.1 FtsX-like permease family protein [Nitrospinaceae bacterium]NIU44333.1 FtsX-like permease family protein [Nitrospinaceae bacterium]
MKSRELTFPQLIKLALAESRGAGKRFLFFVICLAIGVGAVMTIKSVSNIMDRAIHRESKGLLAADLEIKSSWPQSEHDRTYQKGHLPPGTEFQFLRALNAMARFPSPDNGRNGTLMVELKSIPAQPPLYPFYGTLKLNPAQPLPELLADGGVLVEPGFLVKAKLKRGDTFQLGSTQVRITGVIEGEPDRISLAFSLGPRIMVSHQTLESAKLIAPGSRVTYKTLVRLPEGASLNKAASQLKQGLRDKGIAIRTYRDMQSNLTRSVDRMSQYLGALGVIALLMGGIGIAMIIRTFMAQKLDTIAILNCLGATSRTVFQVYLLQAVLMGLIGSGLGIATGYGLQYLLPSKLAGLLNIRIEPGLYWEPALQSLGLGLLTTLLFTVWPLVRAVHTRPLRLFRHIAEEEELSRGSRGERWVMGLLFSLGLAGVLVWQAESVQRGLVFLISLAVATGLLAGISVIALKAIRRIPPSKRMTRRYGLANLYRPNNQAVSIITALGIGIMLVLSIRLVQMDMITMLRENTDIKPPNFFIIDIQRPQTENFQSSIRQIDPEATVELTPLVRARFYSIDGRQAENWQYVNKRDEEWFINKEFRITYMEKFPERDNTLIRGQWWTAEEAATPQVSLEEDAARRLGATLGSKLTLQIQGIPLTVPVTSIRKVDWRNIRTNFYMIFSPGALAQAPVTFVGSVTVDPSKELAVEEAVVRALPNVSVFSTRNIVTTIESVVNKLLRLVDFMSGFAIVSGLFILSGAIASTKFRRLKESAILKTLGAPRRVVAAILGYEYAMLGIIAAAIGVLLSSGLSWAVMAYIVKSDWHLRLTPMGWALLTAVGLTTLTGIVSSLDVLKNKPNQTLRRAGS